MRNKYLITTKEWFDRTYGNSYCAVQIIDNETGDLVAALPIEYGYGSYGEQRAKRFLTDRGEKFDFLSEIAHCVKIENCLKRDVKAFGEGK